ncbi:MAG: NUDIX domain-containing protein [Gemmatimonadales bacterium]
MSAFRILAIRTVHEGWSRFLTAKAALPDGHVADRQIEDHGTGVGVLPYDPERRVGLLVRQPRTAAHFAEGVPEMLETIAGRLEGDEPPPAEARREAEEEAGLNLGELEHVVTAWASPEISTERTSLFLASYTQADRAKEGGGLAEEHECVTPVEVPLADLARMADTGQLIDMKTMLLVQTLRLRQPALFVESPSQSAQGGR